MDNQSDIARLVRNGPDTEALGTYDKDPACWWLVRKYSKESPTDEISLNTLWLMLGMDRLEADDLRMIAREKRVAATLRARAGDNGKVAIHIWQMDCDCSSWTTKEEIEPTLEAWYALREDIHSYYDGPRGPTFHVMTPQEAAGFEAEQRDHALEAVEDGHPHVVYI